MFVGFVTNIRYGIYIYMLSLPATLPSPPVQAHCLPHNNKHPGRSVPPLGSRAGTWSQCTWFWRKFLMAVLFCRQNFHHSIFLSSDYLLENIFSDGDLLFVIRLFTRKIFLVMAIYLPDRVHFTVSTRGFESTCLKLWVQGYSKTKRIKE